MSKTGLLARALILAGCSSGTTEPLSPGPLSPLTAGEIRVMNASSQPFAFFAVAADLAPLLDPVPEMPASSPHVKMVPPGGERPVDKIMGREQAPEGGVAIYLYAITSDGKTARFSGVQMASGAEIRRAGGRIVIRKVPPNS